MENYRCIIASFSDAEKLWVRKEELNPDDLSIKKVM